MTVRKQIRSFGVRYLIRNALVILSFGLLTLLLGSILPTFPGWLLAVLLLGTVLLIIAIEQYGYKTFRCPNCSERLPKASIWDGDEEIICKRRSPANWLVAINAILRGLIFYLALFLAGLYIAAQITRPLFASTNVMKIRFSIRFLLTTAFVLSLGIAFAVYRVDAQRRAVNVISSCNGLAFHKTLEINQSFTMNLRYSVTNIEIPRAESSALFLDSIDSLSSLERIEITDDYDMAGIRRQATGILIYD